jgi:hypothetical protein
VSGLVAAVYRGDAVQQLICAGLDGEARTSSLSPPPLTRVQVRGYTARPQPTAADLADSARAAEEEQIRELGARRQTLAAELKALEEGVRAAAAAPAAGATAAAAGLVVRAVSAREWWLIAQC